MEEPLFYTYLYNLLYLSHIRISILRPHNYNLNASLLLSLTDVSLSNTCRAKA